MVDDPMKHNYMKKLTKLWESGAIPRDVGDVEVKHDSWCKVYSGKYCNCDPEVRVLVKPKN